MALCEYYGMTENQKHWFSEMINAELKETESAIDNETLWGIGSSTEEEALQHKTNAMELRGYLGILKHMIKGE